MFLHVILILWKSKAFRGDESKGNPLFLERNLAKANPSMGDKVAKGICAPTKLNILEPETYSLYRDLMIMKELRRHS